MALLIHNNFTLWGLIWSFSLWLESVAVLPQIAIIAKKNGIFTYTAHYLATLGLYRFFYVLLYLYRYVKERRYIMVSIITGNLQILLYADFFYLYIKNINKLIFTELPIISKNANKEKKNIF